MAEEQQSQEKTEEPTQRRLTKAREEGQVARSRELSSMALVVLGALGLMLFVPWGGQRIMQLTERVFRLAGMPQIEPLALLGATAQDTILTVLPFLVMVALAGVASSVVMGGLVFSPKALAFKGSRMDPLKGFKRMFSLRSLVELAKSVAKFLLIAGVAVATLGVLFEDLLHLGALPVRAAIGEGLSVVSTALLLIGSSLVVVALIDVPFQLHQHRQQLKMSRQEVKDELKDTEGKPEVKARVRQLQQEISRRRMLEDVPQADVVITNPQHFAVAIRYDAATMPAPVVLAKGADLVAMRIREVASAHGVPVLQQPVLTRAVYFNTEIGMEIPAGLYVAVAQVLAYIYQLKQAERGRSQRPGPLGDLAVPREFFVEGDNDQ